MTLGKDSARFLVKRGKATCILVREATPDWHSSFLVTAMVSGTSKTAMVYFRQLGYMPIVQAATVSRSPIGSGKWVVSNAWYHRYKEWYPSDPKDSYLQPVNI